MKTSTKNSKTERTWDTYDCWTAILAQFSLPCIWHSYFSSILEVSVSFLMGKRKSPSYFNVFLCLYWNCSLSFYCLAKSSIITEHLACAIFFFNLFVLFLCFCPVSSPWSYAFCWRRHIPSFSVSTALKIKLLVYSWCPPNSSFGDNVYVKDGEEHPSLGKMLARFFFRKTVKERQLWGLWTRAGMGSLLIGIQFCNTNTLNLGKSKLCSLGPFLVFQNTNMRWISQLFAPIILFLISDSIIEVPHSPHFPSSTHQPTDHRPMSMGYAYLSIQ